MLWSQNILIFINRPGVAGAVLQSASWLTDSFCQRAFSSNSSTYHKSQSRRAREQKFRENVQPQQHVTCHVSRVMCHVVHVTCHMSCVICHIYLFIYLFMENKLWSLSVEGLLSTGTTPSSFNSFIVVNIIIIFKCPINMSAKNWLTLSLYMNGN